VLSLPRFCFRRRLHGRVWFTPLILLRVVLRGHNPALSTGTCFFCCLV
jgi:hypothetical protein